jgi:hypothetical protein
MSAIPIEGASVTGDPDLGKLFDVPRIAVIVDESDPSVLKLAFSGQYELDRTNQQQVEAYNRLLAGESRELSVTVHVAGATMRHRRDAEGFVDAIVQTKSLVVSDVYFDERDDD